jgi:HAMP domain-containing protein
MQHQPPPLDRALQPCGVFRRLEQHRSVDLLDIDAPVLDRLEGVGELDDLARGGFSSGIGARLDEFQSGSLSQQPLDLRQNTYMASPCIEALQAALREMSRSIGGLESTVKSMVQTWQLQEAAASQGRRDLHAKIDAVGGETTRMAAQLEGALRDIAAMKPTVEDFKTIRTGRHREL